MKNNTTFLLIIGCIAMIIFAILFAMKLQKNIKLPVKQESNTAKTVQPQFETQEADGGNVTVIATPEVLQVGKQPRIKLIFDTHTEELDFDVSKVSILLDDAGNTYSESIWEGSPPGGHHINGKLIFDKQLKEASKIKLVITDVSGIKERVFEWKL